MIGDPPILRYFDYGHLPPRLQDVSAPFQTVAKGLANMPTGDPAERAVALRKLLESKDAAVRAALSAPPAIP